MFFLSILLTIAALVGLMVIHEMGHFLLAKKFGMSIEEFGVGLPPKIKKWKIGSTIYSLNLIPFGAFVRIKGEEGETKDGDGFRDYAIWKRIVVLLGGVVATWITAIIILSVIAGVWGFPEAISDQTVSPEAKLQVVSVLNDWPAEIAGIKMGDEIMGYYQEDELILINKVEDFTEMTQPYLGREIKLSVNRKSENLTIFVVPKESEDSSRAVIGIGLSRVRTKQYNWLEAPLAGLQITINQTIAIPATLGYTFSRWVRHESIPGVKIMGPIGIGKIMSDAAVLGINYFLQLLALIAIYLTLFNIFPIPALDGGKILFLLIGKIRKKEIKASTENKINTIFFGSLMLVLVVVTISDIISLF